MQSSPHRTVLRVDLLPPFGYLKDVSEKVSGRRGSAPEKPAETGTPGDSAGCSSGVLECGPYRTRTYDLTDVNRAL